MWSWRKRRGRSKPDTSPALDPRPQEAKEGRDELLDEKDKQQEQDAEERKPGKDWDLNP